MATATGEAMFSITRKNSAGDLVTTRGNTGSELLENFEFMWGMDEAQRYFTEMRHGDVRVGPERAAAVLSGDQVAAKAEAKADAGAKPASKALITAAAKKSGKSAEELAGITTDEAKALVKGEG